MNTVTVQPDPLPSPNWNDFRRQMPVVERWAFLDHAAVSPLPGPTRNALIEWAGEACRSGNVPWPEWSRKLEELRSLAARMIHADTAEIALIRNTTEGISAVAEGFPWEVGDRVITLADEFPSNQYPWLHLADRGVETVRFPTDDGRVDLDQLEAVCDQRTRVISISWVGYASGWRNDLDAVAEIAHRHGALLFVDAIQALGVFPIDVQRTAVDFLAADGHKWMLGPEGAGIFYIRREHLDRLRPVAVGWNSVVGCYDFSNIDLVLKPTAARYEGGSQNMVGLISLKASLDLLMQFGQEALSRRVLEITDLACRRLAEIGAVVKSDRSPAHASGIVSFELPGCDPVEVRSQCRQRGVVLSCRAGRLRISPHAYNDASDLERLVEELQRARK